MLKRLLIFLLFASAAQAAPGVTFSPTSLSFGTETVGSGTAAQAVTLTNSGSSNLILSNTLTIAGTNAADFQFTSTNTCISGATIIPSGTCTFSISFTPSAAGSRTANWTVSDNASGSPHTGNMTGSGLAVTPTVYISCPPPNGCHFKGNGTFTASAAPPTQTTVSVLPNTINISTTGTQNFTATVTNDPLNQGVTWLVTGPGCSGATCGTVSPTTTASNVATTYTAPNTSPSPNTVSVTATSITNPQVNSSATASINVTPPPPPAPTVTVAPAIISVTTSATQTFTCTVKNDPGILGCDWTLSGTSPQGSLSTAHTASGVALTYTAPGSASSAVVLTAKSTTDATKMAASAITVTAAPVISVNVSPTTAPVGLNSPQSFTATVTNDGANLGVTWTETCGVVSPGSSASGVAVTYTSPATAGPCIVTATSVANAAKSASATVTVSAPTTVVNPCAPNVQTAAALNTFTCPPSQGSTVAILVGGSTATTTTGVQVCNASNVCTNMVQGCPPTGACFASIGGGMGTGFYAIGLPAGQTTYKVSNSPFGNQEQVFIFDQSNLTSFDTAIIGGSNSASLSASQTITTRAAGTVLSLDATLNVTAIAAPFSFTPAPSNSVGGTGFTVTSAAGSYTPTFTQQSAAYALYSMAFATGFVSPIVGISVSPATANVATSATLPVTATISNGSKGATWALSGSGCSGATCGALSATSSASGVSITYTAPGSVPSPATVTLTATSVDDPTKTASTTITVTAAPVISVTVTPTSQSLTANATQNFSCTVTNDTALAGCDWTLGGTTPHGSLSTAHTASGNSLTYTAPGAASSGVTLTAASTTNPAKSATANITVSAPVITVSISPSGPVTTNAGNNTTFTATVVNSTQSVNWTLASSATSFGSLSSASGATTTYTAPNTNTTITVTLTGTSIQDGTKSSAVTINVNPVATGTSCAPNCPAFLAPAGASPDQAAQGGGAATPGGRGGKVYEITTTNDSSPGCNSTAVGFTNCSYRDCWMDTKGVGARYCVFRLAGIFAVTAGDLRTGSAFMTVLGQTAPGEVILGGTTTNGALGGISTHDIIVRYVTYSPDNPNVITGPDGGTTSVWIVNCGGLAPPPYSNLAVGGCHDIIFDHITTRWSGNKSWITTSNYTPGINGNGNGDGPNHNITTQWFLMYEPQQGHPVGYGTATDESCVGQGPVNNSGQPCLSPNEKNIDWHHGIVINTQHRIPETSNVSTRWTNVIVYNWGDYASQFLGAATIDVINSKYITGNLNAGAFPYPIHFTTTNVGLCNGVPCVSPMGGAPSVYVSGSVYGGPGSNTPASDQYGTLTRNVANESPGNEIGPIPSGWIRANPMPASNAFPIVPDPANQLDTILPGIIGNSQHLDQNGNWVAHRDPQDTRVVNEYLNGGSGGYWPNAVSYTGVYYTYNAQYAPGLPTSCNGNSPCQQFPTLQSNYIDTPPASGTPPVCSLHDGVPDAWKVKFNLSTTDTTLYKSTDQRWGIPVLEVYANGLPY